MNVDGANAGVTQSAPRAVSLANAVRFGLRRGLVSFGGPAGQVAVMQAELFERRRWISEKHFLGALNYVSAVIALAAAVAPFRFRVGVLPLPRACAVAGLTVTLATPQLR